MEWMEKKINEEIKQKKEELKRRQEIFRVYVGNDSNVNGSSFEHNAINDLLTMKDLKTEIKQLEMIQLMFEAVD